MARRHASTEEEAEINITPMLDMVFILLIFFIVTSSFVQLPGVKVNQPQAVTAEQLNSSILIGVTSSGQIWMHKEKVNIDQVRGMVQSARAQAPNGNVVILADQGAPTGVVTKVMGQAASGGAKNIALAAKQSGSGS
jgi:biopolymer transport protein ExbD